jgi:hypothetical protein
MMSMAMRWNNVCQMPLLIHLLGYRLHSLLDLPYKYAIGCVHVPVQHREPAACYGKELTF